ncbi:conserved protein of unknown function [Xenorhabdus poinarii G6]|uniref:DUF6817 domain-containing protein n=1 Tax=Xenorhabdus poinarii G6 TaxID=1354304 RepID=A0A068R432_9GAMM|nr:hypothetical protein [Xenorhabdus poinarii]CDG20875.1 conserved protein of unknown function [Xenorhabdus poinarii G6]
MNLLSQIALSYEIDKSKIYGRHHSAHLIQTAGLLRKHGCRKEVIAAGLIHSIYDSNSIYQNNGVPITDRKNIIDITNKEIEELAYYYSLAHVLEDYNHLVSTIFPKRLIGDLADILVCDIIEQIIWCVDEKKIFTYQDAYEHLHKLSPVISYCRESIKVDYYHYLQTSLS